MKIKWSIGKNDIKRVHSFVNQHQNAFVNYRDSRTVKRQGIKVDKNTILKTIAMCLLTSQQRSGPKSAIGLFLQQKSFPLTALNLSKQKNVTKYVTLKLKENGLNRFKNKIPHFFTYKFKPNKELTNNY